MKIWALCSKNTYTEREKAYAILFEGVSPKAFVPAFVFEGVQLYTRIK